MKLSNSVFPRWGVDQRNSGHVRVCGPVKLSVSQRIDLSAGRPVYSRNDVCMHSSITVREDGSLVVLYQGCCYSFSSSLSREWIFDAAGLSNRSTILSQPTLPEDGSAVFTASEHLIRLGRSGERNTVFTYENSSFDDSGLSPSVIPSEGPDLHVVLTTPGGSFLSVRNGQAAEVPVFYGYDVVSPAVYHDGTLLVSGYWGTGLCRTRLDGSLLWQSSLENPDQMPALNSREVAAVGSLNEERTVFVAPDGTALGSYPDACVCSEYDDESWILCGQRSFARVTSSGKVLWKHTYREKADTGWGRAQALVDREGKIYTRSGGEVRMYDGRGKLLDVYESHDAEVTAFAIIAESTAAAIVGSELVVLKKTDGCLTLRRSENTGEGICNETDSLPGFICFKVIRLILIAIILRIESTVQESFEKVQNEYTVV